MNDCLSCIQLVFRLVYVTVIVFDHSSSRSLTLHYCYLSRQKTVMNGVVTITVMNELSPNGNMHKIKDQLYFLIRLNSKFVKI